MYLSLFSFILSSIYSLIPIEMGLWFDLAIEPVKSNQIATSNAVMNDGESRNEANLRQRAIAQGYRLEDAQIDPQDPDGETYSGSHLSKVQIHAYSRQLKSFCLLQTRFASRHRKAMSAASRLRLLPI